MPYIALKTFDGPGGTKRRPGEIVPEASTWKNPQPWVNSGHVKFVSDAEIKAGRWMHYDAFAGGGAVRAPAPMPAPEPKQAKAPAPEPEPELDVGHQEPEHMAPESTPSAKRGSKKGKHRG